MGTLYITYKLNGILKRATVSESQYKTYENNPSVSELIIYPSQSAMEGSFNEAKGIVGKTKQLLLG
jgi:hypothetical protein